MLRIIVRQSDEGAAMHVGGPVQDSFITFDVDLPGVEAFLRELPQYTRRSIIGVELLPSATPTPEDS